MREILSRIISSPVSKNLIPSRVHSYGSSRDDGINEASRSCYRYLTLTIISYINLHLVMIAFGGGRLLVENESGT